MPPTPFAVQRGQRERASRLAAAVTCDNENRSQFLRSLPLALGPGDDSERVSTRPRQPSDPPMLFAATALHAQASLPLAAQLSLLTDPLARDAALTAALGGAALGALGAWAVLWRAAFFAHAAASLAFPAAVAATALGAPIALAGAAVAALYGAAVGALAGSRRSLRGGPVPDTATALAVVAAFALGVIAAGILAPSGVGLEALLFGSVLATGSGDRLLLAVVALVALALHLALRHAWLAIAWDARAAAALGLPVVALRSAGLVAIAAAIGAVLPSLGSLLAPALATLPAAAVLAVRASVRALAPLAALTAAASGALGVAIAFALDLPPGPVVALVAVAVYAATVALATVRSKGGATAAAPAHWG